MVTQLLFLSIPVLCGLGSKNNILKKLGLYTTDIKAELFMGIKLFAYSMAFSILSSIILVPIIGTPVLSYGRIPLFLTLVLAPISEELFFRGFLSQKIGVIPSSVIFGILHFTAHPILAPIQTFIHAMVWSKGYQKRGCLIGPILAHMLVNFVAILGHAN